MNVEVDRLAGEAYSRLDYDRTAPDIPAFPEEVYAVFTAAGKVVGEMRPAVQHQCAYGALKDYQQEKHGLGDGQYEGVDWKSLHGFLRKKPPPQRSLYVKQQNGWLPTQAFLFLQRRVESDICPLCGEASETMEHVYRCSCLLASDNRKDTLKTFQQALQKAGTAPEITNCWMTQLHAAMGMGVFHTFYIHDTAHHRKMEQAVGVAWRHQALLTWEGFLQGWLSKEWEKVQRLHEQLRGIPEEEDSRR